MCGGDDAGRGFGGFADVDEDGGPRGGLGEGEDGGVGVRGYGCC
jgi:hypothetical protein